MKALLILSEMPETCKECPCKQDDFSIDANNDMHSVIICGARGYQSNEPDKRPEWCPLIECPEKMSVDTDDELDCMTPEEKMVSKRIVKNSEHFRNGWNACLDTIIRQGD